MSQPKIIDNRSLSCPLPVVNTKKAMEELTAGQEAEIRLTSLVDNETAAENVARFARSSGCQVETEKKDDGIYIHISKAQSTEPSSGGQAKEREQQMLDCSCTPGTAAGTVMLITSATLGRGSEELGALLMRSFIFTLKEKETPPGRLLFLNGGVKLTVEGSPVLEELQEMAEQGVEIYSCGTCLDYYQLKDKLKVGQVTNMYDTVDTLLASRTCFTI